LGKELSMDVPKLFGRTGKLIEWKSESSSCFLCYVASGEFVPGELKAECLTAQSGDARNGNEERLGGLHDI
jgi:hypothetical protein